MRGTMLTARDTQSTGLIFASRGSQADAYLLLIFWFLVVNMKRASATEIPAPCEEYQALPRWLIG